MASILDKDRLVASTKPPPEDPTPVDILVLLSGIFIILFFIWLVYLMISSVPLVIGEAPVSCPIASCATNIYNGQKTCLGPNDVVEANPSYQVCNSSTLCDNSITPYALQNDGSTNVSGVCEPGIICRCLSQPQCPDFIVATFNTINGNPYTTLDGTRTAFVQSNITTNSAGFPSNIPPLKYQNPLTSFCSIPADFLPRASPGCNSISGAVTAENLQQCFNTNSACKTGTLAFIPEDINLFNSNTINSTPLGCVRGVPCEQGQVAVWDRQFGGTVCRIII